MKHKLDLLFPFMLWGALLVCCVLTILMGIHFYENTNERISATYESRTALSYLREKIHQNDEHRNISLGTLNGNDSLIIQQSYNEKTYFTYIYVYEHALWELMAQDGISVSPEDGTKILEVQDLQMEEPEPGRFHFSYTDTDGHKITASVSTLSH